MSARGDRHMRQDPAGILSAAAEASSALVRVLIDNESAATAAGQHLIWMLVNQLARQDGLVASLDIVAPVTKLLPHVALFGHEVTLRGSLLECAVLAGHKSKHAASEARMLVVVGRATVVDGPWDMVWYVHADGWKWAISTKPLDLPLSASADAIGPYLAAAAVAGEIFKRLRGLTRGHFVEGYAASALTMEQGDPVAWPSLPQGPELKQLDIGRVYFAGCGAVAQACLATIGASALRGEFVLVDHESLDEPNLNRYVLSMARDAGIADTPRPDLARDKVEIARDFLQRQGLMGWPVLATWSDFLTNQVSMSGLPYWVRADQKAGKFDLVFSCVDKNRPRHEIQNAIPRLIVGGSTDGLTAKSEIYAIGRNTACLKCFNPVEDAVSLGRQRLKDARESGPAAIAALAAEAGLGVDIVERMAHATGCGELTPNDLSRFAMASPDMSVGFVSLAGGVLQLAQAMRWALGQSSTSKSVMAFGTARMGVFRAAVQKDCDCESRLRAVWKRLWPEA